MYAYTRFSRVARLNEPRNQPLVAFEQTVLTEREYVKQYRRTLWTKLIVIDLFGKVKLVGLLGYPDLPVIVWNETERSLENISYPHQPGGTNSPKSASGCPIERQLSTLLARPDPSVGVVGPSCLSAPQRGLGASRRLSTPILLAFLP
jgi:hypothetical protein